jgi:hypothetical protein
MGFNINISIPNGGMEDDKSYVGGWSKSNSGWN